MIKIKWFGHSLWQITDGNTTIVTDPYTDIGYKMNIDLSADVLLSSHDHFDHNNFSLVNGNPLIINSEGDYSYQNVEISMIPVWHDKDHGAQRGKNLLMKFTIDGKVFLHCGDLGHIPSPETCSKLAEIDILLIPVGGVFTINASEAAHVAKILMPELILPMHYQTPRLNFELEPLSNFLDLFDNVIRIDSSEFSINPELLDRKNPPIVVMNYE